MLFGLFPPSISHEGYASKPAYSYWDVFWGLLGYKDAVYIADTLSMSSAAKEFTHGLEEFRRDVYASMRSTTEMHGISYVPGAADLGRSLLTPRRPLSPWRLPGRYRRPRQSPSSDVRALLAQLHELS